MENNGKEYRRIMEKQKKETYSSLTKEEVKFVKEYRLNFKQEDIVNKKSLYNSVNLNLKSEEPKTNIEVKEKEEKEEKFFKIKIQYETNDGEGSEYFDSVEDAIDYLSEIGEVECTKDYTYDCQDMPDKIRKEFFDSHYAGNDCHVTHYVESGTIVGDYLIEEGFEDGDEVIVKHWW